ncbi:transcription antitermination factor NusB [Jongsikchunia kroppenstedtii]|uniref:transcription antitermination factor NusB n=1 Tax=Jongsikchunia kroppenstedtii TaxID=1121721 RepID=UPI0003607221|nr:transcription antitermination factor NusB [Jongsikchunia kroppenstedtii]
MKKPGTRHKARKRAVDLLFEAEVKQVPVAELVAQRRKLVVTDESVGLVSEHTEQLVNGVDADKAQLDAVISSHLEGWTLERMPGVDRAILRLATWELFNATDVPPMVAVDEAVQLAKELSTDESPSFVNGVLGRIVELAPQVRAAANASAAEPGTSNTASDQEQR